MPKSFDYLKALDLESDLKRRIEAGNNQLTNEDNLYFKVTSFIQDQDRKLALPRKNAPQS